MRILRILPILLLFNLFSISCEQITSVPDELSSQDLKLVGQIIKGPISSVAVQGDLMVIPNSKYAEMYDISDPDNIKKLATLDTGDEVEKVFLVGNTLIVKNGWSTGNFVSYDLTDLQTPEKMDQVDFDGAEFDDATAVTGEHFYVADKNGLTVYSISEQGMFTALYNDNRYQGYHLTINDTVLYTDSRQEVYKYRLSADGLPEFMTILNGMRVHDSVIKENVIYSLDRSSATSFSGLYIIDITDPESPVKIDSVSGDVNSIALYEHHLYVSFFNVGLRIFDVSEPSAPEEVGLYPTQYVAGMAFQDDMAFLVRNREVILLDITQPAAPGELDKLTSWVSIMDVKVDNNTAFLADGCYHAIRAVDVSDRSKPEEISFTEIPEQVSLLSLYQDYAYVSGREYLWIFDISHPGNMVKVDSLYLENRVEQMEIQNEFLFANVRSGGIYVIDISSPRSPEIIHRYEELSFNQGISVKQDYLYVVRDERLYVLDISNPTGFRKLKEVWLVDHDAWLKGEAYYYPRGMVLNNGIAYISSSNDMKLVDLQIPADPVLMEESYSEIIGKNLSADDSYLYFREGAKLKVYDISEPRFPREVAVEEMIRLPNNIDLDDQYIYVAGHEGGFEIFEKL